MPRKTTKLANELIDFHNQKRKSVESTINSKGFFDASFNIAELKGVQETIEKVLDFQGCNHGNISVDSQGQPSDDNNPEWRVSFNKQSETK